MYLYSIADENSVVVTIGTNDKTITPSSKDEPDVVVQPTIVTDKRY